MEFFISVIGIISIGIGLIEIALIFTLLGKKKPVLAIALISISFGIVGLIQIYKDRVLIFKQSEKNIFQIEQNNNDNKSILIQKKIDAYYNGPDEVNLIKDVPEEFYNHVYYSYLQPSDNKIVFCSEYTTGPGRMLLDVEDDTFFYFICTKEIADTIIEIHKSKDGPGSGWK